MAELSYKVRTIMNIFISILIFNYFYIIEAKSLGDQQTVGINGLNNDMNDLEIRDDTLASRESNSVMHNGERPIGFHQYNTPWGKMERDIGQQKIMHRELIRMLLAQLSNSDGVNPENQPIYGNRNFYDNVDPTLLEMRPRNKKRQIVYRQCFFNPISCF